MVMQACIPYDGFVIVVISTKYLGEGARGRDEDVVVFVINHYCDRHCGSAGRRWLVNELRLPRSGVVQIRNIAPSTATPCLSLLPRIRLPPYNIHHMPEYDQFAYPLVWIVNSLPSALMPPLIATNEKPPDGASKSQTTTSRLLWHHTLFLS